MNWRLLTALPLVLAIGCKADADGDGLTNKEEKDLGLDPEAADSDGDGADDGTEVDMGSDPLAVDSDGDGLLDGQEVEAGSDPTVVDTDGDGYTDRDEVHEEKDPADERDVIYKGGWPYYFEKTELNGGANYAVNKRFKGFEFKDQYGDTVDLWDFYNEDGKYVIIDVSAGWCPPCQALAGWLDGEDDAYFDTFSNVRDAVDNGDVYWITVLGEGFERPSEATKQVATEWHDMFPHPKVPVLADKQQDLVSYVNLGYWPTTILLGPDLKVIAQEDGYVALSELLAQ